MNKTAYERLPDDLKKVIDANSGLDWAMTAGRGFDSGDVVGREATLANGTLHEIAGAERIQWEAAAARTTKAYIAELDAMGLPGTETYAAFQGYVAECKADLAD